MQLFHRLLFRPARCFDVIPHHIVYLKLIQVSAHHCIVDMASVASAHFSRFSFDKYSSAVA